MEAEWWSHVVSCMGDGVLVVDRDGVVLFANPAAEATLRTKVQGARLSTWAGRIFRADETTPLPYEELPPMRAARGEVDPTSDIFVRWASTRISVTSRPLRDARGNLRGSVSLLRDVTEQRRAESELLRANRFIDSILVKEEELKRAREDLERRVLERTEELRRAEEQLRHAQKLEAVGRLAGGVAHDFNNVLAVILGHVGLLAAGLPEGDPVRSRLDPIREAAEHAAALTRQLLAFSRKQVMQPRILNLNRVVEQARGMLARLLGEDVELVTQLSPDIGNILADPALIEQVIINLALNARDAMPHGGVLKIETASANLRSDDETGLPGGRYALLRVTDTGVGMDEETRSRAFEPFFTTKAPGKGTGLGLSMAYGVVAQSGGSVRIDSAAGRGTSLNVYLPCASAPKALTPSPSRAYVVRGSGETVLIAEDEAPLREILRSTLEHAGYRVLDAGTGADALELCSRHEGPVHLLLSDVVMPVMDGPELARRLRSSHPSVRVLFMSGYTDERLADHEFSTSAQHLKKPFSPELLTATVRAVLDG